MPNAVPNVEAAPAANLWTRVPNHTVLYDDCTQIAPEYPIGDPDSKGGISFVTIINNNQNESFDVCWVLNNQGKCGIRTK